MDLSTLPSYSYAAHKPKVDYVIETFRRQIARPGVEWARLGRVDPELPYAVRGALEVATETWAGVRWLCSDIANPAPPLKLAAAVPPLARMLAELIYWHVYLFDDPIAHFRAFQRSAWAKLYEHHAALENRYGQNPAWKAWLRQHRHHRDLLGEQAKIDPKDRGRTREISKEWPVPGRMLQEKFERPERRAFLIFFDQWYYGTLSQDVHFTGLGYLGHTGHLLFMDDDGYQQKYRSDLVAKSLVLYLCFLSEFALDVTRVGHPIAMLRELWRDLGAVYGFAMEMWVEQFEPRFAAARDSI